MPRVRVPKVKEIMKKDVAFVELPGSRDDVLDILKDKHVSGVPVVKEGELVGIVTRTDLLKHPEEDQIALLMTRNPITVEPDATIIDAAKLILKHNVRRLPVTRRKKLLGIITTADIISFIAKLKIKKPIGDIVSDEVFTLWDETPLPLVGRIMELGFLKAAPVLNSKEELVGIVTDRDLIAASVIEDSIGKADLSAGREDDEWTWESTRDTMKIYYGISKVKLPEKILRDVMVKKIETALKTSEVSACAERMARGKYDQMPVVDARNRLVGMLKDRDLLKAFIKEF
jgi:CBS domain-containing protein